MSEENKDLENKVKEEEIDESAASDTLRPQNTTKSHLLSQITKHFAGKKKEDLSSFLIKTLQQVGKEADSVPDTSGRNKTSISMSSGTTPKPSASTGAAVKEDIEDLFGDNKELSEEFKNKTYTLFEAALNNRLTLEVVRLQEEFDSKVEEEVTKQVTESVDELHEQVEKYMDYIAETWLENNEIAIENNIKTEVTENFIEKLADLFKESYVDLPEDKLDIIEKLTQDNEELKEEYESVVSRLLDLEKEINEANEEVIFDDVAEGLADTQKEKLKSLIESLDYEDLDEYKNKIEIVKEQYFGENKGAKSKTGLINEEEAIGFNDKDDDDKKVVSENMKPYVDAIGRTVTK